MKKNILKVLLISSISICGLALYSGTCPEGYDAHEKYAHGDTTLCDRAGDNCCTPSCGGINEM